MIYEEVERRGIGFKDLAVHCRIHPSRISNFLNGKEGIGIDKIYKLVRYLFPERESSILLQLCRDVNKPQHVRFALEYAAIHMETSILAQLIDRHQDARNAMIREWVRIYSVVLKDLTGEFKIAELPWLTRSVYSSCRELNVLLQILEAYRYYDLKKYRTMLDVGMHLESEVEKIEDEFLRQSYASRLYLIFANGYMRAYYDLEKARFYAQKVIEYGISGIMVANAYEILALSYLFEDYERTMAYYEKFLSLVQQWGNTRMMERKKRTLYFIRNYWGVQSEVPDTDDISEIAHYYIRRGESERALSLLDQIDPPTPFTLYYKGIALKDLDLLCEAIQRFNRQEDKFFSHMVKLELMRLGIPKALAEAAYS